MRLARVVPWLLASFGAASRSSLDREKRRRVHFTCNSGRAGDNGLRDREFRVQMFKNGEPAPRAVDQRYEETNHDGI